MRSSGKQSVTAETLAQMLWKIDLKVQINVAQGGQRLDILATTQKGARLAVLLKPWVSLSSVMIEKAEREAKLLTEAGGVDHGFIVIPSLEDEMQTETLRNVSGLCPAVETWLSLQPDFSLRGGFRQDKPEQPMASKQVFVAMPFAPSHEDIYYLGILPTVEKASAVCVRVDEQYYSDHILNVIYKEIERSDLVIADVTGGNPNVVYELGYAHGLKKPTVHLSATPPDELPFDIRQWSTVLYAPGQIHRLKPRLESLISQMLEN